MLPDSVQGNHILVGRKYFILPRRKPYLTVARHSYRPQYFETPPSFAMNVQRSYFDARHDHGYWSPSNSAANFCEEDYIVSHYIAEFANTLSNLAYIYYALYPPQMQLGSTGIFSRASLRDRFHSLDMQSVSLILVGVSSGLFHASMHALPQWLDESSMYLLAGSWIYILLTTSYTRLEHKSLADPGKRRGFSVRRTNRALVTVALVASLALSSFISHVTGNLAIHSVMFGLLLVLSGIKMLYFIFLTSASDSALQMSRSRKVLLGKLAKAIFFLCLGFGLWLVDCNPDACQYLRHIRSVIMSRSALLRPLTFVFELHAWWHIFTARAAGEYISLVRYLTTEDKDLRVRKST